MADSADKAKVIPITRGFRKRAVTPGAGPAASLVAPPGVHRAAPESEATQAMLAALHPRVRAVLVARHGKWEYFERIREARNARSILQEITLRELMAILERSRVKGQDGQRITVSPWQGFDLAILLRDGKPLYAVCFDPETSVYIAEATLPEVARYFDAAATPGAG